MHVTMSNLLILSALAASLVLVFRSGERIPAFIALAAAALEALMAFGFVTIRSAPSLGLILAAALAVAGCWAWMRAGSKPAVTAATVVALVGVIQVLLVLLKAA